jgi:hypothetical protein
VLVRASRRRARISPDAVCRSAAAGSLLQQAPGTDCISRGGLSLGSREVGGRAHTASLTCLERIQCRRTHEIELGCEVPIAGGGARLARHAERHMQDGGEEEHFLAGAGAAGVSVRGFGGPAVCGTPVWEGNPERLPPQEEGTRGRQPGSRRSRLVRGNLGPRRRTSAFAPRSRETLFGGKLELGPSFVG